MNAFSYWMGLALTLGAASPPATATDPKPALSPTPQAIRVLSDVALRSALEWASDVRWASDKSVYLGLGTSGTFEVRIDRCRQSAKGMIPGRANPGGFWASKHVAASSQYLAAAGPALAVTWRRIADPAREEVPFDFIQGIDVQENRLAILGARRDDKGGYGTDGAIAWIGALDQKLTDLRPVLYDIAGPGSPNMGRCGSLPAGAVRFLPERSLLVVPGVQPGISLFDGGGQLIRTWDTASLGIDSTCAGMTDDAQAHKIMVSDSRYAWLNQWRTVDTVLPLRGGPGLVVRRVENGHTHWDLKILKLDGTARTFALPFEGGSEFFHLKGDVRAGKIVFLLYETVFNGGEKARPARPRLIVAEPAWPDEPAAMQVLRMPIVVAKSDSFSSGVAPAVTPSALAIPPAAKPTPPPNSPGIRSLSDTTLPQAFDRAADVRWASDTSVYLSLGIDGAKEVSLDPAGPPPREMIPGSTKPGGFWGARHVAASSQYFAAAGQALVATWRRLADPAREEAPFDSIQDIDVQEGRFAIVGAQRSEDGLQFAPDGAIAWTGTFDKKLTDLRPLLFDSAGPGAPNMARCGAAQLGAVRFLNDGSLVVVPGVQPGVNLYDRSGKLIRTWDSSSLGIDAACGTLTDLLQANRIMGPGAERNRWLNQWRTVDTLLPLAEGPGLVVRKVEKGHTRWDLKLLRLDGTVLSIELPFEGSSEFFHLEGDVRDGKIVFVLRETVFSGGTKDRPSLPRLIVAELLLTLPK